MGRDKSAWWSGVLAVGAVLGGGLLAVGALFAFVGGYVLVMLFWATVVLVLVALGVTMGVQRIGQVSPTKGQLTAPQAADVIEREGTVGAMGAPLVIRVVGIQGICPLGLEMSNVFTISPTGQVVPRLCRPALEALRPLLLPVLEAEQSLSAACECPLKDRWVRFSVGPAELIAA